MTPTERERAREKLAEAELEEELDQARIAQAIAYRDLAKRSDNTLKTIRAAYTAASETQPKEYPALPAWQARQQV